MSEKEKNKLQGFPINVRGEKVALGPFLREHLEIGLNFSQDPEIEIYGGGSFDPPNLEQANEHFDKLLKDKTRVGFAIYALENLTLIGNTSLRQIDHRHGTATLGIGIWDKNYWGKGYGTEAVKLILDYGFKFLNLYNIDLYTSSFNERAVGAYKKAGFKEIGRRRGGLLLNGQRYDDILMDCLASEFVAPKPGWFEL